MRMVCKVLCISVTNNAFFDEVANFNAFGKTTIMEPFEWEVAGQKGMVMKAVNEYWTSGQRQANSLHEISYRACFKPQLPEFFIARLSQPGDGVYDPFMGRGTTPLEAALLGRIPLANDINPLSRILLRPRLHPPTLEQVEQRLNQIDLTQAEEENVELLHFFHRDTLREIIALKEYLLQKDNDGTLDFIDDWIRMVAVNRLSGHSTGFFSVYSLPPNQAVSIKRQKKINDSRGQVPDYRAIKPRILKKSKSLLKSIILEDIQLNVSMPAYGLANEDSKNVTQIPDNSAQLVVTSPPFLDVIDYQGDNWLRCWFIGIDSSSIEISRYRGITEWEDAMTDVMLDLRRIVNPGGHIAFEVGEVRGGKILLEENVVKCGVIAGLEPIVIMINDQKFTKTANTWGVDNSSKGTNTNRIVVFHNAK